MQVATSYHLVMVVSYDHKLFLTLVAGAIYRSEVLLSDAAWVHGLPLGLLVRRQLHHLVVGTQR
jgi:hypothetical protein